MNFLQSLFPTNNYTILIRLSLLLLLILSSSSTIKAYDSSEYSIENCEKWCLINECGDNPTFMMKHCKAQFEEFQDNVLLITNVASYCSKTEQHYKELVKLHTDISKLQLTYTKFDIFAFPSNQFLNQEPESSPQKLKEYIQQKYNVQFTIMSKIDLNGSTSSIVYKYLKSINDPFKIKDCFYTYFIVDGWGKVHEYTGLHPEELYEEVVMFIKDHERARELEEKEF